MVVASVAPAEADADPNRPASGSPVFFPGHIFFIHYREVEGLAGDVTANLHFCQHVAFAPGDTVHPLLALLVCFDGEGILIKAGQRQLVGNAARDPDQYFTDPVLGYFFVCGINLNLCQQLFGGAVQQFRTGLPGEAAEHAAVVFGQQEIAGCFGAIGKERPDMIKVIACEGFVHAVAVVYLGIQPGFFRVDVQQSGNGLVQLFAFGNVIIGLRLCTGGLTDGRGF